MKAMIKVNYDTKAIRDLKRENFIWDANEKVWYLIDDTNKTVGDKTYVQYHYDRAMQSGNVRYYLVSSVINN